MTPVAQIIAIAKACGKIVTDRTSLTSELWYKDIIAYKLAPDYLNDLNDLNAMHEAEKVMTEIQWLEWERIAARMTLLRGSTPLTVAIAKFTATQRAEVFLRTLNLWDDSK